VREGYRAAFGVSQEARFRSPAGTREGQAKQEFRDWDAEIASRIERMRAEARGEGLPSLSPRKNDGGYAFRALVPRLEPASN
jgi:hypothetical protein